MRCDGTVGSGSPVKYAVTSRGTLISIEGSIVLPASGLAWPTTSFSLQRRGILRSRLDGEGGKNKPHPNHRDEHKDGEPNPPSRDFAIWPGQPRQDGDPRVPVLIKLSA